MIRYEPGKATVSEVDQLLKDRDTILDDLRMHLERAQHRMKLYADTKRRHEEFKFGEQVFLKINRIGRRLAVVTRS